MSTVKSNRVQVGQSVTPTNNGTWYQPGSPDGTIRYGIGDAGATTLDVLTLNSSGKIDVTRSLTVGQNLTVSGNTSISNRLGIGTSSPGNTLEVAGNQGFTTSAYVYSYAGGTNGQVRSGLYLDGTNTLMTVYTAQNERMRIDASGRVTMPYQPAFYAYRAGATFTTSSTEFIFDATRLNRGSHYSTTTGRFTAPVAGAYFFSATGLPNSGSATAFLRIFKNNGTWSCSTYVINADQSVSLSVVMDMAAGDYASVYVASDGFESTYCCFSGFLIG